jgi:hypothetical protein
MGQYTHVGTACFRTVHKISMRGADLNRDKFEKVDLGKKPSKDCKKIEEKTKTSII